MKKNESYIKILDQWHTQEWFFKKIERKEWKETSNFEKIQIKNNRTEKRRKRKVRNEKI